MEHIAILDKKRKLLQKIVSGEKTIESRWYLSKRVPWGRIKAGEKVYFKESGEPVHVSTTVSEVMQFYLPCEDVRGLVEKYGPAICFDMSDVDKLVTWCSARKYCILIRLKDVEEIAPFEIDKKGFGMMAAWITMDSMDRIKKH